MHFTTDYDLITPAYRRRQMTVWKKVYVGYFKVLKKWYMPSVSQFFTDMKHKYYILKKFYILLTVHHETILGKW